MASLAVLSGMVLDGIRKNRHELSRLSYMRHPAVRDTSYVVQHTVPVQRLTPERTHAATHTITAASVIATGI